MQGRRILIAASAPPKPAQGAACNGCGVCCAAEPCPLGVWISRRRHGACAALLWVEHESRYRCGVIAEPGRHLPWLPAAWAGLLARRWIAAGAGCDASLEVEAAANQKAGVPPAR
ncbi:hypothetical protein CKO44_21970 [Rubrivivax gelatinosus]|uniref:hypothetical protein n=1 Tax=Rubrivivax gelatinosus TaxID=28068 RepID=UPI001908C4A9|nr:hypothetical protein [Rubrivivax gelatinosus]MBK1616127.1 hypothetical protein [Rubrivivax gelatinosus]